ncbi:diguanylate cyclase [Arenimonas sp.]|uniref:diguanylate cyclase n=1 Tax=Arenimonas sp. TaxID=1872635 RepID=UPI0039E33F4A
MHPDSVAGPRDTADSHTRYLQSLPRRTYGLRVLGMGLGALPVIAVLHELKSPWPVWAWAVFSCLLWPHLAYLHAKYNPDPFRAELRNFVVDSFFAGSWAPLMHFNVLPSVVLVAVVMADKLNTGIRGLWLRSLPGMFGAMIGIGIITGFAVQPYSSMTVVLASLPILVIHTLAVSLSSYRLLRRVQRQNMLLEQISRVDALTGLFNRGHWERAVETFLRERAPGTHAALLLVDIDEFKIINDVHGHPVGDDVLRGISVILSRHTDAGGLAGRLGGDELALALPVSLPVAESLAEGIRADVQALRFPRAPNLVCSVSIGIAATPDADADLREWTETADRALYRAKQGGRNRTAGHEDSPKRSVVSPE